MLSTKIFNFSRASCNRFKCKRKISALYITGDKANENYVVLQPYMDFKSTFADRHSLEESLAKRKLQINLQNVLDKYEKYQKLHVQLKNIEEEQQLVVNKIRQLAKTIGITNTESDELRDRGRKLRNSAKELKQTLYPVEDDFAHCFLNLPNKLHKLCPHDGNEFLLYRSQPPTDDETAVTHLARHDLIKFIDNTQYYMLEDAAHFDTRCMQAFSRFLVDTGGFLQTANPDFVRCVLLEAASATPQENYHLVKEDNLQNNLNTAYLTGGAAFESFLGAVTKLCVYPTVLPLRYVCAGRSYVKVEIANSTKAADSLYTVTQTNAVQTFVATKTAQEADEELERILNLCIDFYKTLGVPFRIVYADASALQPSECLRAALEIHSPALQQHVCVGHVSNFSNYISKRILFSTQAEKSFHFLHLIGGPVVYTTRLIGALIENGISLSDCRLLGDMLGAQIKSQKAVDEFKNIFK